MDASAKTVGAAQTSDDVDIEEEEGEVIESAPPLQLGEERLIGASGVKKKLLKLGTGWETPENGDEATVHYVGTLLDGKILTRDKNEPVTLTLKVDEVRAPLGLGNCIMTMKRGELALFTLPADLGYGAEGCDNVPPNSVIQFEIELFSWIPVVDIRRDGGIIKKVLEKGNKNGRPGDLDEVLVKYQVELIDGTVVAKSPEEGIEFCVNDGHLCPALPLAVVTMHSGEKVKLVVQPQYGFGEEGRNSSGNINAVPPKSVLNIDLVLVSYKPVIDVMGDSKVFKKILRDGEGTSVADDGATVTVSYVAKLEDGTIFERKGGGEGEPLVFVTDEEQVISGLDKAAATMKRGEKVVLTISPDYGFGNVEVQRDIAKVPQRSVLIYEVEMLDFVKSIVPDSRSREYGLGSVRPIYSGSKRKTHENSSNAAYVDVREELENAKRKLENAKRKLEIAKRQSEEQQNRINNLEEMMLSYIRSNDPGFSVFIAAQKQNRGNEDLFIETSLPPANS